jgi:hypothetical protein
MISPKGGMEVSHLPIGTMEDALHVAHDIHDSSIPDQLVFACNCTAAWPVLVAQMGEIWSLSGGTLINEK